MKVDHSTYDVFVSYSRRDTTFVELLVKALKNYTPPKALGLPARRLKVFMDTEDLYGSEYFSAIDQALKSASKLVIVCSPQARASVYIADEIKRFVRREKRTPVDVVPVLHSGLPNNEARQPEDEARKAFPDVLYDIMEMPLAVDFRGFDTKRNRIDSGAYHNAWFTLLATVLNVNRDEAVVAPEGPLALAADREGKRLSTFDPIRGEPIGELVLDRPVTLGGLHPSEDRMALVDTSGHVSVRNRRLDNVHASFKLPGNALRKQRSRAWRDRGRGDILR